MEKETLEEFIDRVDTPTEFDQFTFDEGIRVGAKWQQERMYSEREAIELLIKFNQEIKEVEDVREWFEQFKKK